jgi:hypothetical protein
MSNPDQESDPFPESILVPVPLRQKVPVSAVPVPQHCEELDVFTVVFRSLFYF